MTRVPASSCDAVIGSDVKTTRNPASRALRATRRE
jgi:hypothetical protein